MKEMKKHFKDSWQELRQVKVLVITAMLIAVGIILGFFTIPITPTQRVGFSSIANELIALLFGPVVSGLSAGISDILKHIIKPMGPFFPGFTISALVAGLIYGAFLYRRRLSFFRVLLANITVTIVVNMTLNNIWMAMMYGSKTFGGWLIARAPIQIMMIPIDAILFFIIASMLKQAKVFNTITYNE